MCSSEGVSARPLRSTASTMRMRHDTTHTNRSSPLSSATAGVSERTGHAASAIKPRHVIRQDSSVNTTRPATFSQLPIVPGKRHRSRTTDAKSLVTCARLGPPTAESFPPRLPGTSASTFNRSNTNQHPDDQLTRESGIWKRQDSPRVPTPNGTRSACRSVTSQGRTGGLHIWMKPSAEGKRPGPTFDFPTTRSHVFTCSNGTWQYSCHGGAGGSQSAEAAGSSSARPRLATSALAPTPATRERLDAADDSESDGDRMPSKTQEKRDTGGPPSDACAPLAAEADAATDASEAEASHEASSQPAPSGSKHRRARRSQAGIEWICNYPGCDRVFKFRDSVSKHARHSHQSWYHGLRSPLRKRNSRACCRPVAKDGPRGSRAAARLPAPPRQHAATDAAARSSARVHGDRHACQPTVRCAVRTAAAASSGAGQTCARESTTGRCVGESAPQMALRSAEGRRSREVTARGKRACAKSVTAAAVRHAAEATVDEAVSGEEDIASEAEELQPSARGARATGEGVQSDVRASANGPRVRWNRTRQSFDVVLPHGAAWSRAQMGWFIGTWWTHLAFASSDSFEQTLQLFSAWANEANGTACLTAWLARAIEAGDDVLGVRVLELLEYATLKRSAQLSPLLEQVRGYAHSSQPLLAGAAARAASRIEEVLYPWASKLQTAVREAEVQPAPSYGSETEAPSEASSDGGEP